MPELKQYCRTGCWLFAAVGLAGCGREAVPVGAAVAEPVEFRIPAIPLRDAGNKRWLVSDWRHDGSDAN